MEGLLGVVLSGGRVHPIDYRHTRAGMLGSLIHPILF